MVEYQRKKCESCGAEFEAIQFSPSSPCGRCGHPNYYNWGKERQEANNG